MNKLRFIQALSVSCSVLFAAGCTSDGAVTIEVKNSAQTGTTKEVVHISQKGISETRVSSESSGAVVGSGNVKTEKRNLSGFSSVDLRSAANVDWTIGPEYKVSVEADDNLLPLVKTEVQNQSLIVDMKGCSTTAHGIMVHVQAPHLVAVKVSGSGNVAADDVKDNLALLVDGSGNVTVTGKAEELSAAVNGSGNVEAQNFKAHKAHVVMSGSGNANVYGDENADLVVNGSGNINVAGKPKALTKVVNGSGAIQAI